MKASENTWLRQNTVLSNNLFSLELPYLYPLALTLKCEGNSIHLLFFPLNIFYHHRNRSTKFLSVCNSHQILNLLMEVMTLLSNNVPFIQRYSVNVELIDSFDKCETSFKCHFLLLELKVGLTLLSFRNEAISNMPSVKEKKKTCKLQ